MRNIVTLLLLLQLAIVGCSSSPESVEKNDVVKRDVVAAQTPTRRCYRNEYRFEADPDQKDVEFLSIEISGDRVVGEYNWLPAFKDRRIGHFAGVYESGSVTASYHYTQEGQSGMATIRIWPEETRVIVEGGKPELGLNATIGRVEC